MATQIMDEVEHLPSSPQEKEKKMESALLEDTKSTEFGDSKSHHFVLVHGACHGAWCWYKVSAILRSSGHRVTVLDMEASGIHPKKIGDVKSRADYVQPLMEFMDGIPDGDKVVLVGHNMGGVPVSMALERFPEKVLVGVYATALMTGVELSMTSVTEEILKWIRRITSRMVLKIHQPLSCSVSEFLSNKLYQLSPLEDLMLASYLSRPTRLYNDVPRLTEDTTVTRDRYGLVDRVFIICDQDLVIDEDLQRRIIARNPPREVKTIPGCDHMVMFSKPRELCSVLEDIARDYASDM